MPVYPGALTSPLHSSTPRRTCDEGRARETQDFRSRNRIGHHRDTKPQFRPKGIRGVAGATARKVFTIKGLAEREGFEPSVRC
jgi:hypothetical protein